MCAVGMRTGATGATERTGDFYYRLDEMVTRVPKRDQLVLMEDLNARVGRGEKSWRGV